MNTTDGHDSAAFDRREYESLLQQSSIARMDPAYPEFEPTAMRRQQFRAAAQRKIETAHVPSEAAPHRQHAPIYRRVRDLLAARYRVSLATGIAGLAVPLAFVAGLSAPQDGRGDGWSPAQERVAAPTWGTDEGTAVELPMSINELPGSAYAPRVPIEALDLPGHETRVSRSPGARTTPTPTAATHRQSEMPSVAPDTYEIPGAKRVGGALRKESGDTSGKPYASVEILADGSGTDRRVTLKPLSQVAELTGWLWGEGSGMCSWTFIGHEGDPAAPVARTDRFDVSQEHKRVRIPLDSRWPLMSIQLEGATETNRCLMVNMEFVEPEMGVPPSQPAASNDVRPPASGAPSSPSASRRSTEPLHSREPRSTPASRHPDPT